MATDKLQTLADKHGIAGSFTDNFGHLQLTESDVMRAILCALGESVDPAVTERATGAGAALSEAALAITAQSAVMVVIQGEPLRGSLDLPVPATLATFSYHYSIEAESGVRFSGSIELQPVSKDVDSTHPQSFCSYQWQLQLPLELDCGYHSLLLEPSNAAGTDQTRLAISLIVVPQRAVGIDASCKPIGVSVQLYSLRSENNWGIGDFTDLKNLCSTLASYGIDTVGLNPVHALYRQHPDRCSPYSPSSRVFLNPLYIDVMAVSEAKHSSELQQLLQSPEFSARLQAVRDAGQVDYNGVAALKFKALRVLFHSVYAEPAAAETIGPQSSGAKLRFRQYVDERGGDLQLHARFEAFDQHFTTVEGLSNWIDWPACYHDPDTPECRELAAQLSDEISFSCFLQWLADEQLAEVVAHTRTLGMRYGLYMDLAVGVDRQGGEVWARPQQFARGMHIGAPPDALGPLGQDWSLTPYNPSSLKDSGYRAFVDVLRVAMRFAGILRIDHVMGLVRQYWCVPALRRQSGMAPGAYIDFPVDDLLGLVALESQRNQCVVIGEDLGTVPDGFRDKLRLRGIHGYRVLYFEKDKAGNFHKPQHYEPQTLATASTHDLPTLAGFLNRRDILLRASLGHIEEQGQITETLAHRQRELANLLGLLARNNPVWLESDFSITDNEVRLATAVTDSCQVLPGTGEFINAVHRMLAQAQSAVLVLQLEDLLQQLDMVNLPGTIDEHPNWRRRLPVSVEALPAYLSDRQTLSDVVELRKAG